MHFPIKAYIVVIGFIMLLMACANKTNNKKQADIPADSIGLKDMKCKIIITNYYFGRKQYITTVSQDSLQTVKDDMNGKITNGSRALTKKETETLCAFLAEFPLSELKKQYVTETVEDGTVIDFSITINNQHKDIYTANMYQKDLGELVEVLVKMLKEDYIGYNPGSVPYKE